jgi:hypothetical protein
MFRCFFSHILSATVVLIFIVFSLVVPAGAASGKAATENPGYVSALSAANRMLQAWQTADAESGMALLTTRAKGKSTPYDLKRYFSDCGSCAYEIVHGKTLRAGRYEFPVVLLSVAGESNRVRRRFSSVVVVRTGGNDWAIDRLP